ncbi:NAD(P)-dependent oxidoreductase [Candidatus Pelagibacter sp.]|nr:NAD(P)-dependent oxidoreductase [Candidatus Pelagibacter sp.]
MNKILLTGSTGFIGSQFLKNLSKNNKVYVTLRKKNKKISKNKNIIKVYFNNFNNLNKRLKKINVDIVIHCATHYVKQHEFSDINKLSESNILFGNIILENLKNMKVKKFINFTTVWENFDGEKNNFFNLYSVYKKNFSNLISFYNKKYNYTKFYNLFISDTFGEADKRRKIINLLRTNFKRNKLTTIVSKNLFLNLLNVEDIIAAANIILKKNIVAGNYTLKNNKTLSISKIISTLNATSERKMRIKWISNKVLKEKIYNHKALKGWRPNNSGISDIVDLIKR